MGHRFGAYDSISSSGSLIRKRQTRSGPTIGNYSPSMSSLKMINSTQTLRERLMHLWFVLHERWTRFFFEPVEPSNLGLCRVLFYGAFFLLYLPQDWSAWAYVGDVFFQPIVFFQILQLPVLSSDLILVLQAIWKASLALSCLGLFTRASTMSSLILGVYLLGLPNNFGKIHEHEALVVICLGIMALSRCGDAYSIDQLIRKARRGNDPSAWRTWISGEYTWPVRNVWLMFALVFFLAGVSKLRHSGLEWIFSDNMAITLMQMGVQYHMANADPLVPWGPYLAQHVWLTQLMAAGTLVLEVGYPLALFSSRARWVIVPSMLLLLIGVRVLMGPTFVPQWLILYLFWVPWDRVSFQIESAVRKVGRREWAGTG
jgi:hypothetical protein